MFKKDSEKFTSCIGTIVLLVLAVTVGTATKGWALSVLWNWFVVTAFEIPSLAIVQAIGIAMVVSFLTSNLQSESYEGKDMTYLVGQFIGKTLVYPVLVVAIGWLVSGLL